MADGASSFDVVALASSAGGLTALSGVVSALPPGFGAGVVIVQHLDPRHRSLMADILGRRTSLPVKQAEAGDLLEEGRIYKGPADKARMVKANQSLALTQRE